MAPVLPILALALASPAVAAEAILVPDFTPGTTSEFALAFMLQDRVIETLRAHGHVVVGGDAAAPVTGPLLACADDPACPFDAMQQLPVRWGLVVRVERRDGTITGIVTVYEKGGPSPVDKATLAIEGGEEQAFADTLAGMIAAGVGDLGGSDPADLAAARALLAGDTGGGPPGDPILPPPKDPPGKDPKGPPKDPKGPPGKDAHLTLEQKMETAGLSPRHLVGARASLGEWEGPPLEWLFKQTPHAGRLLVEVRGGLGIGDVDRHADARLFLDTSMDVQEEWFQEGPAAQKRPRGALYIGWAPSTYVDEGAQLGLQYGHRTLSTGYYVDGELQETTDSEVQAVQAWVQPMVRLYVVPLGAVKPYVFTGADLRMFDDYKIAPGELTFPAPPGGAYPGAIVGGGLMVDPGPIVGFFVEGSYTRHFGIRAEPAQSDRSLRPPDAPPGPEGTKATTAITGGVQFRL